MLNDTASKLISPNSKKTLLILEISLKFEKTALHCFCMLNIGYRKNLHLHHFKSRKTYAKLSFFRLKF